MFRRRHSLSRFTAAGGSSAASWRGTVWLALGLSAVFLLLCLGGTVRAFVNQLAGHKILQSIGAQGFPPVLVRQLVVFGLALVAVHAVIGGVALLLTAATETVRTHLRSSRRAVMFLWFIALVVWILAANAVWFPHSQYSDYYGLVAALKLGPWSLFQVYSALLLLALVIVALMASTRLATTMKGRRVAVVSVVALAAVAAPIAFARLSESPVARAGSRPNVILLGVDSLRLEQLREFGGSGLTPHIDDFLAGAAVFHDAITPESRTFSSWTSILTGRHPDRSGAVFNLMPRDLVDPSGSIGHRLQAAGYRTVFAIDEVRFANFDESYGFDQVVTPPIGARDFLIGSAADLPWVNIVANGPMGRWLFPDVSANRGMAVSYRADAFIDRIGRELELRQPTLFAAHLTLPHWPYYSADIAPAARGLKAADAKVQLYRAAVVDADRQFGEILALLKKRGFLQNALVIALSDHGEAMSHLDRGLIGEDNDADVRRRAVAYTQGHGTSVLTEAQYKVLLGFRRYGVGEQFRPGARDAPASLEDILPTVLQILNLPAAPLADGLSLLPALQGQSNAGQDLEQRIRFTETDFNVPRMLAGDINVKWLAMQSIEYYRVDPQSGWVEFRREKLPEMMALKERAAIQGDWLMAALPGTTGSTYVLVNRKTRKARLIPNVASAHGDLIAGPLLAALLKRYPNHLAAPVEATASP